MRKAAFLIIAVIVALLPASCNRLTDSDETDSMFYDLCGTWVKVGRESGAVVLRKSENLDDNQYGLILQPDGKLVERKNISWCATPPVIYGNYQGEWKMASESLIDITVGYWGGTISYQIEIVSLSFDELRIRYHYNE